MAYQSGGLLPFVRPDLSTRLGAKSAMDSAKVCFLLVGGFRFLIYGIAALGGGMAPGTGMPFAMTVGVITALSIDIGVPLLAAWRLHIYRGAFIAPIATVLYVSGIDIAPGLGSIIIGVLFTAVFVGGIRGAWALRRGTAFEDDYTGTFS